MNKTYLLVSEKSWNENLISKLSEKSSDQWVLIDKKDDFSLINLDKINPDLIFIPHWSHIIPAEIYDNYECIVFHMTDLPFGRGGSPLQNLIVRGYKETKISAIKVEKGLDTGDIYLKKDLSLEGTAQQIFERANGIIETMIREIVDSGLSPVKQKGEVTIFKRRKPSMSNLSELDSINKMYDYIRMLDAEGYPHAFIENEFFKFEFTQAKKTSDKTIEAHVRIIKK